MKADRIMLIEDGKIVSFASHDELWKTNNLYQKIVESQLGKESGRMQRELTDPFRYPKPKLKPDPQLLKKGKNQKIWGRPYTDYGAILHKKRDYYFLF